VYVPAASAQPFSPDSSRVFSSPDSAVAVLGSNVAMMDLSFTAYPLVVHQSGMFRPVDCPAVHALFVTPAADGSAALNCTRHACIHHTNREAFEAVGSSSILP